jgi:hypothetical protein
MVGQKHCDSPILRVVDFDTFRRTGTLVDGSELVTQEFVFAHTDFLGTSCSPILS